MLKKMLAVPPILIKPTLSKPIIVYLATPPEAMGATLILKLPEQKSIYFVSRALQSAKTRYQLVEKIALAF